MKLIAGFLAVALISFLSAALAQTPATSEGSAHLWPWSSSQADKMKLESRQPVVIYRIDGVEASILKSNPPKLSLKVKATAPTGGYSDLQIIPVFYPAAEGLWPTDGFYDFVVYGRSPSGVVTQQLTPVEVEATFDLSADTINGVRIHGGENCILVQITDKKPNKPGRCESQVKASVASAGEEKSMTQPNTTNWKAWEDRQPGPGKEVTLYVTSEVETGNSNQTPHLKKAVPQGINPAILILDLTISTSGIGNPVMGSKTVRYEEKVKPGQYTSVDIHWKGKSIARTNVEVVE